MTLDLLIIAAGSVALTILVLAVLGSGRGRQVSHAGAPTLLACGLPAGMRWVAPAVMARPSGA